MSLFKSLINYIKNRSAEKDDPHPASRNMALGANGAWLDPSKQPICPVVTPQKPLVTPLSSYETNWWNTEFENSHEVLDSAPTYFPHASQLGVKLNQCLDIGIITSCAHKSTGGRLYHLEIELPCTKDVAQDTTRFNLFIRAMEEQYNLALVHEERVSKETCYGTFYRVVFEYNPNKLFLKTRDKTRR